MRTLPILFRDEMVLRILDGSKTQTRRLNGRIRVGDQLWVREATKLHTNLAGMRVDYRADGSTKQIPIDKVTFFKGFPPDDNHWRPNILMPRCASRLTLEVTEVRCQRLQDITGEDANAEGIVLDRCGCEVCHTSPMMCPADASEHVMEFARLWDSINKTMSWSRNPWVFAYTFKVL